MKLYLIYAENDDGWYGDGVAINALFTEEQKAKIEAEVNSKYKDIIEDEQCDFSYALLKYLHDKGKISNHKYAYSVRAYFEEIKITKEF